MLARCSAVAAFVGGLFWLIKAAMVLATGNQPAYLFEVAPLFFSVGLIGLHGQLQGRGGRLGRAGGFVAYLSLVLSCASFASGLTDQTPTEGDFDPLILGSTVSIFVSLVLLGICFRRSIPTTLRWPNLPFIVGISAFPLILVGGFLETFSERLLEVPILLIGAVWLLIGVAIGFPPKGHTSQGRIAPTPSGRTPD
jgi:hypothetical protein